MHLFPLCVLGVRFLRNTLTDMTSMYNFVASLCTTASSPPLTKKIRVYYRYDRKVQNITQLLDEVEHNIMNYQNLGLCYLPKPKAEADNTDKRF